MIRNQIALLRFGPSRQARPPTRTTGSPTPTGQFFIRSGVTGMLAAVPPATAA
ncbi:hypothetical protein K2X14_06900 [Acetobacter sp. TBRC 12305]|uniref:Uncharacterized protein n=1 Tax=Acetobacter garciniae TaxID=2817435 RepID=A0A939HPG8_9PROT|nr:hypothetical protein [Acetobacter garciniae]MBO1324871.1 hypothetical protein [Acetobacter garciniae]MBX0344562.1 hypothetical protein [Acetobacter garciniae]